MLCVVSNDLTPDVSNPIYTHILSPNHISELSDGGGVRVASKYRIGHPWFVVNGIVLCSGKISSLCSSVISSCCDEAVPVGDFILWFIVKLFSDGAHQAHSSESSSSESSKEADTGSMVENLPRLA